MTARAHAYINLNAFAATQVVADGKTVSVVGLNINQAGNTDAVVTIRYEGPAGPIIAAIDASAINWHPIPLEASALQGLHVDISGTVTAPDVTLYYDG